MQLRSGRITRKSIINNKTENSYQSKSFRTIFDSLFNSAIDNSALDKSLNILLQSDKFKKHLKTRVRKSCDGIKRYVKEIYCLETATKKNIFPQFNTNNNVIPYYSDYQKIYELDLLPFECPTIKLPTEQNQKKLFVSILTHYTTLVNKILVSNKIQNDNDFYNLLRKLTYLNFIYNFICDNVYYYVGNKTLSKMIVDKSKMLGGNIFTSIRKYATYVEENEDSYFILSEDLAECIYKLKESFTDIDNILIPEDDYEKITKKLGLN